MKRRKFVQSLSAIAMALPVAGIDAAAAGVTPIQTARPGALNDRQYWINTLTKMADPVLLSLSRQQLKVQMPVEAVAGSEKDRRQFTHLEAFGRLLAGMAPWLELGPDGTEEGRLRQKYIDLVQVCIRNAVDPSSKDYMNFGRPSPTPVQSVVDAAFMAHGLLRAPKQVYGKLDAGTKQMLTDALRISRGILPGYNNWLLFAAMVETMFLQFDQPYDIMRLDYALRKHDEWYKGDGIYGDGPNFHWDYYNSFVIHPMMMDITATMAKRSVINPKVADVVQQRAQRYAFIQERLIASDGSFPVIGRSICYRQGVFQALAQVALQKNLPKDIKPAQVRSALTAVMKKIFEAPGVYDKNGWLQIGLAGHQPSLGEGYISTGSLYLASTGFLPLGLPPEDPFWSSAATDWSARKIWAGEDTPADHAINI